MVWARSFPRPGFGPSPQKCLLNDGTNPILFSAALCFCSAGRSGPRECRVGTGSLMCSPHGGSDRAWKLASHLLGATAFLPTAEWGEHSSLQGSFLT